MTVVSPGIVGKVGGAVVDPRSAAAPGDAVDGVGLLVPGLPMVVADPARVVDGAAASSFAAIVTVASGPTLKFGLTVHPPGFDRCTRKLSAGSRSESSVVWTGKVCDVSLVNEIVRRLTAV